MVQPNSAPETQDTARSRADNIYAKMTPEDRALADKMLADAHSQVDPSKLSGREYAKAANDTLLSHPGKLRADEANVSSAAGTDQTSATLADQAAAALKRGDYKGAEKYLKQLDPKVAEDKAGDIAAGGAGTRDGKTDPKTMDPTGSGGTDADNAKTEAQKIALEQRMLAEGKNQWGGDLTAAQKRALGLDLRETRAEFLNNIRDGKQEVGYAAADDTYTAARQRLAQAQTPTEKAAATNELIGALTGISSARKHDQDNETGDKGGDGGYYAKDKRNEQSATEVDNAFFAHTHHKKPTHPTIIRRTADGKDVIDIPPVASS